VLISTPNEGSPVVDVYRNAFKNFVNDEDGPPLFNLKSDVVKDLVKGKITPRVPGINYYVVAGTRTYEFNLGLFRVSTEKIAGIDEKNDGIISVKSAQHVGDRYIDNRCIDYWEMNLTHTKLIKDPGARKVIERIISRDIQKKGVSLGHNKYFDLSIKDSSPDDNYIIIGKKIRKEFVLDETGCSCGNGYCGEGEDKVNCPADCRVLLSKNRRGWFWTFVIVVVAAFAIYFQYSTHIRFNHPYLRKMVRHIKTHYDVIPNKGYTHSEMKEAFLREGWPERIVNDTIRLLKKEFHHTYHKPLKRDVKEHLGKGYGKEEVKKALVDSGWEKDAIDRVLRGEELELGFRLKKEQGHKAIAEGKKRYFYLDRKA